MTQLQRCVVCQERPVAWRHPRVDYCYQCLPGGPFTPPPCRRCGSRENYFTGGLCEACHPDGPRLVGSCRGCLAWGVYRQYNWNCWNCRWWRTHYPLGTCRYCGRESHLSELGACRLCLEHARLNQQPGRALDLTTARFGQQLSLADMVGQRRKTQRIDVDLRTIDRTPPRVTWRQEVLFEFPHDIELVTNAARNVAPDIIDYCKNIVADHSASHGWSKRQTNDVIRSLRLLYLVQDSPLSKVKATEVLRLHKYNGNVISTLDVLAAADLLIDDRVSRIDQYFAGKTAGLPETILAQLQTWLDIRLNGRSTAPRLHSRLPQTVRIQIAHLAPIVQGWADQGYTSLAEVTAADLRNALPPSGAQRSFAEQATRSLFSILKTEKLIFSNPARGQRLTRREHNIPLPLNTEPIVEALNSPYPGVALVVALAAFHALTNKQIRELQLTDIADGRLSIGDRNIPLATPVRVRLQAWLEHRACTWPATLNPYLLVSKKTGPRLIPVSNGYAWRQVHLAAQAVREDRIVQEINATGGDVRRLCDLFGMSVESAMRYTLTLAGSQAEPPIRVPRTRTIN